MASKTWLAATDGLWNTPSAWSPNLVPAAGDDVFITATGAAYSILLGSSTETLNSVTINSPDVVLDFLSTGRLNVTGVGGTDTLDVEAGTINLSGGTITATGITLGTSALLEGNGIVTGGLSGSGSVLATGGDLTLQSAIGNQTGVQFTIASEPSSVLEVDASIGLGNTFTFLPYNGSTQEFIYNNLATITENIVGLDVGSSAAPSTNFVDFRAKPGLTVTSNHNGTGTAGPVILSDGSALKLTGITNSPGTWFVNTASDGAGGTDVFLSAVCYTRGTHILTPTGEMFIEDLKIGDLVVTRFNGIQPIRWIGRQSYDLRFIMANRDRLPVRIQAGALGDRLPARDLYVSPGHSMLVGGQLVLAWSLVNGVTITQDWNDTEIHYFQIELKTHDCVIAEGAWSETYADGPGLRERFHNAAEFAALYPDHAPPDELSLCAPRPERGAKLDAVLRSMVARASSALKPGPLRGYIDRIEAPWTINGWANDANHPEMPVLLEVLLDDRVIGTVLACDHRADLAEAGIGQGRCAFFMKSPVRLRPEALATLRVRRASDKSELLMTSDCAASTEAAGEPPPASGLRLIA